MDILSFDIETIPQQYPLSEVQQQELKKKLEVFLTSKPNHDKQEARKLIMGTSPYFGEIICIGIHRVQSEANGDNKIRKSKALIGTEYEIIENFWKMLRTFDGIFVSYNGISFDVPFIIKRSMKHRLLPTNQNFLQTNPYKLVPHFDVQNILADFDRYNVTTLRMACDFLGVPSPKEGEIKAEDVAQAYSDGKIEQIAEYCVRDVESTFEVYNILKDYIWKGY